MEDWRVCQEEMETPEARRIADPVPNPPLREMVEGVEERRLGETDKEYEKMMERKIEKGRRELAVWWERQRKEKEMEEAGQKR